MKLSILVPAFNEQASIRAVLEKLNEVVFAYPVEKEIIVIDDCSVDATGSIVSEFASRHPDLGVRYFKHDINKGKGAALHTGIREASGDLIVVQDADLEYDPTEFNLLLGPIFGGQADVVFGSRFMGGNPHRILFFWHTIGNNFLTFLSNMLTNLNLTDMETCYKLFRADKLKSLILEEQRFGFEPEVTAKISQIPKIRIYEVGISYYGRTYEEGKKINWRDGFRAIYCIIKYNLFK